MALSSIKRALRKFSRTWLGQLAIMFAVVGPLRSAVIDWNWVPSGSMQPTILVGDLVLVNKLAYDLKLPFTSVRLAEWSQPARGDITVCFSPRDGTRLVKRVVGLPGDWVEMQDGVLVLNGIPQRYTGVDSAALPHPVQTMGPLVIARERLDGRAHYVMGQPALPATRNFGPVLVPPGHYFMMGDSRDNSLDSRVFGPVPEKSIVGRAAGVLVSFDPDSAFWPRFSRFFSAWKPAASAS
jgi:signal peptidase I